MTEHQRKKPKKPFDYRNRVLAPRSERRKRSEGNQAMKTSATPQPPGPSASEPMQRAQVPSLVPAAGDQSIAPTQELPAVVAENSNPAKSVSEAEGASTAIETGVTVQPPFAAQSRQLPLAESSAGATQVSAAEGTAAATKDDATNKKAKADPENLEQFIEYAYSRKGQRLTLKPKVEKQIAQNCRLDDAALSRLQNLSKADTLLAVPRQILLVSQEVIGLPGLRAALTSFVSNVMLCHPAFGEISVQGALRNLPEGLPPADATAKVAAFVPVPDAHAQPLKGTDLQELRHNAVQLFVTWLAVCRGLNSEELSSLLFQVIWQPAAKGLADDNARLRALTDIGQAAGVGLACQRFRQQAIEARAQQDLAQREASGLRDRLAVAETQLAKTTEQLKGVRGELGALRGSSAAEMEALRRQHSVDRTHLQHELEQLRGRLVKRLTDSVDMLEVGLSALRKDMPRVQVMVERAEHVVDALRAEVRELKQE